MFLLFLHHPSSSARLSISKPRPIIHSRTDVFIQKPRHPIRQMSIVTSASPLSSPCCRYRVDLRSQWAAKQVYKGSFTTIPSRQWRPVSCEHIYYYTIIREEKRREDYFRNVLATSCFALSSPSPSPVWHISFRVQLNRQRQVLPLSLRAFPSKETTLDLIALESISHPRR